MRTAPALCTVLLLTACRTAPEPTPEPTGAAAAPAAAADVHPAAGPDAEDPAAKAAEADAHPEAEVAAAPAAGRVPAAGPAPSRAFRFHYEAAVEPDAPGQVDLWIPIPTDTPEQRIRDLRIDCSHPYELRPISRGGGRALHSRSRSQPIEVRASWWVERREATARPGGDAGELARALEPDTRIPLDGEVARVARGLPSRSGALEEGRLLYDHTLARMSYEKPAGAPWGRGDAEWACSSRYGNCTDFHSYFIGLARSKGIPARFEIGFSIPDDQTLAAGPAEVGGYHCWAWFWSDDAGWVPVDISEADKHPGRAEYYFGHLDANRLTMTSGRDLVLDPPTASPLNFFVYPYAEVDGVPGGRITRRFFVTAE